MARFGFEMDRSLIALDGDFRVVVSDRGAPGDDGFFAEAIGRFEGGGFGCRRSSSRAGGFWSSIVRMCFWGDGSPAEAWVHEIRCGVG